MNEKQLTGHDFKTHLSVDIMQANGPVCIGDIRLHAMVWGRPARFRLQVAPCDAVLHDVGAAREQLPHLCVVPANGRGMLRDVRPL
eukprot:12053544-Alexandrium_andersonii.AAC.1